MKTTILSYIKPKCGNSVTQWRYCLNFSRRMTAPELPPITSNGKKTGLLSNGYLRSYSFHKLPDSYYKKRNSIHSDSSLHRYQINSHSRTSSSSSQKSRGRVLSAGTYGRTNRQVLAPELPRDSLVSCECIAQSLTVFTTKTGSWY